MPHKHHRHHFYKGLGFVALSAASGVSMVFLASSTVGLVISIAGIPLAILTGMGTVACATGTAVFASKAVKHFHRHFKDHDHMDFDDQIETIYVSDHLGNNLASTEENIKEAYKPLFTPTPGKTAHNETEINNSAPCPS